MEDLTKFTTEIKLSELAQNLAADNNFVIKSYKFNSIVDDHSREVKIAAAQVSTGCQSVENFTKNAAEELLCKIEKVIEAAALEKVNIVCLPELWGLPYPFHKPVDFWAEFAENIETGPSTKLLRKLAEKFGIMIITSILEREVKKFFNTCLVISTTGKIVGKYRKNHIPSIEAPFLDPGWFDQQVFDTEFGKIGIVICYERHFPLAWMTNGLDGAEIVFNPSSEDDNSFSERLWFVEGVNAAAANGYFTVAVNRTGTETFNDGTSFTYFGSNYVASPEGFRTPHLPRNVDGLLISEIDLNRCRKVKQEYSFHQNQHLSRYADMLYSVNRNSESHK